MRCVLGCSMSLSTVSSSASTTPRSKGTRKGLRSRRSSARSRLSSGGTKPRSSRRRGKGTSFVTESSTKRRKNEEVFWRTCSRNARDVWRRVVLPTVRAEQLSTDRHSDHGGPRSGYPPEWKLSLCAGGTEGASHTTIKTG